MKRRERVGRALGAAQQPARDGHALERRRERAQPVGVAHPRFDPVSLERAARAGIRGRPAHHVAVGAQGARQLAAAATRSPRSGPAPGLGVPLHVGAQLRLGQLPLTAAAALLVRASSIWRMSCSAR